MMKKLLILLFVHFSLVCYSQDWLFGSSSNFNAEAFDIVIDNDSNTISVGYISGFTNFKDTFITSNNGNSDVFVSKFDKEGVLLWTKQFGGNQQDRGLKVAVDRQNNIYFTGTFFGNINFDSYNLQSSGNSKDLFLVKLNASGSVVWARKEGGDYGENPYDLTIDNQDNIILTGQFEGVSTIGNQTFISQVNSVSTLYSFDIFLAKYANNGTPIWSKQANSEYEDRGMAVTTDLNNNIYLTGQFSDSLSFFGQTVNNQIYNAGFVAKISPLGDVQYFKKFAAAMALPYDIKLNAQNEIYITGDFLGNLIYFDNDNLSQVSNPYAKKIFILKLTNAGNLIWGKAQGSNSELSSRSLTVDPNQDIYIGGYFSCTFDEYKDLSLTSGLWNSVGFKDVFVSKFSPTGTMIWNKQNGGKKDDLCYSLSIKKNDEPVYCGSYENNFIIPTLAVDLAHYDTTGVANYHTTYPTFSPGIQTNFRYYILAGDDSKNVFIGKVIKTSNPTYYYYKGSLSTKSYISPLLEPNVSVFNTCIKDSIEFKPLHDKHTGPGFNLLWNGNTDPDKNYFWNLTASEQIILNASTWDNCYTFSDTITIILHDQFPVKITDNKGFNNLNLPQYDTIYLCYPDVAQVTPSDLCTNCTFQVRYPDTSSMYHQGMAPFNVQLGEKYFLRVYNEFGCMRQDTLHVVSYNNQPYSLIDPDLVLYDTIDFNDSLVICQGDTVLFWATDLIVNPDRDSNITYFESYVYENFTELNFGIPIHKWPQWRRTKFYPFYLTDGAHWAQFFPTETGWYKIRYDYILGYNNFCGMDVTPQTYIDSFYIEVKPLPIPDLILTQDGPICPGEITTIQVQPSVFNFTWDGPGITWSSADSDSLQVSSGGTYTYSGILTHQTNGCQLYKEFEIEVFEKSPPPLLMNPIDGVICPNQIVDITITQAGAYEWYGVNGSVLSSSNTIQVENQGFYYCIFTDLEGCTMATQQVEIREYTSPSISVFPDAIMCDNEIITLNAIYFGISNVYWQAPLNASLPTLTISQPGTYVCEISQCGITVKDSVVILDGNIDLTLSASETTMCYGDSVIFTTNPGNALYVWNEFIYDDNQFVAYSPGDYFVTVTNPLVCSETSDTITIGQFPESILPPIADTNICPGASITLTHNSPFQLVWYEDLAATTPIINGPSISFTNVLNDSLIYAAYESSNCPLAVGTVFINVIEPLLPPVFIGDQTICEGDSVFFEILPNDSLTYEWYLNGILISNNYSTLPPDSSNIYLNGNATLSLTITDFCSTNSNAITLQHIPKKDMTLNIDEALLCPQNPLLIYPTPDFENGTLWINGSQTSVSDSLLIYLNQLDTTFIIGKGIDEFGCYSIPDTVDFIIPNLTYLTITQYGLSCESYDISLVANSDVSNLTWYLPDGTIVNKDSITIQALSASNTGYYTITAIDNEYGCVMHDSINLINHPLPIENIGNDTSLCHYYSLSYAGQNSENTYSWNGIVSPNYFTNSSEQISVLITSPQGCQYIDSFTVYFSDCVPVGGNVFTPNGDGINDYLIIDDAKLLPNNCIIILNRWGNVVFESQNYQNNFNGYTNEGKELHDGVYYYLFYTDCEHKKDTAYQGFFHIFDGKE